MIDDAEDLTLQNFEADKDYGPMLCGLWERMLADTADPNAQSVAGYIAQELNCAKTSSPNP